jgi:hypothetical protein
MEISWLIGIRPAGQALLLEGDRRDLATTKRLFASMGIDASPGVVQI